MKAFVLTCCLLLPIVGCCSSTGEGRVIHCATSAEVRTALKEVGPGLLGQYVDIKYAASAVTVRNNVFHCGEKSYNEEIIKLAGYGNRIENNRFVGAYPGLTRYIHIFNKKTRDPVRVEYQGRKNVPAPTGRDNVVVNNVFYVNDPSILPVDNDVSAADRSTILIDGNRTESPKVLDQTER